MIFFSSADRDGCSPSAFHQHCDGRHNLILVASSLDGYIYGGYAPLPWVNSKSTRSAPRSFLFRLRTLHNQDYMKFPATKDAAVISDPNAGPTFGTIYGDVALQFSVDCSKEGTKAYIQCKHIYVDVNNGFDRGGEHRNTALNGSTSEAQRIGDIQIYKLESK